MFTFAPSSSAGTANLDQKFLSKGGGATLEARVPKFYFDVNGADFHWTDLVGRCCADLARREATLIAGEMITSSLMAGKVPHDAVIEVEDEAMRPVLELPLRHAGC